MHYSLCGSSRRVFIYRLYRNSWKMFAAMNWISNHSWRNQYFLSEASIITSLLYFIIVRRSKAPEIDKLKADLSALRAANILVIVLAFLRIYDPARLHSLLIPIQQLVHNLIFKPKTNIVLLVQPRFSRNSRHFSLHHNGFQRCWPQSIHDPFFDHKSHPSWPLLRNWT